MGRHYTLVPTVCFNCEAACGLLAYLVQLMYQGLLALDYPPGKIKGLLLSGFVIPVFFISLAYYRVKRNRLEKDPQPQGSLPAKEDNETD